MSNGDADAVKALLAEGADVDQRARGGQTALMLAAIFGHLDIVRLLLAAGADLRLQDDLGLTAREWADRRGSSAVAQFLSNASPAEIVPSSKNASAKPARREVEAERRNPAAGATTAPQQDAPNGADDQQRTKPEPEGRKAEEAQPTATESARIAARIEHLRILEESRQRIEEEVRAKSQRPRAAVECGHRERHVDRYERDTGQEVPTAELSTRPAIIEAKTSESLKPPPIKRCPKCDTTYENVLLRYCAYDATRLISADDSLFNSSANDWAQPTLWALVAILAVGGASIGYLINNYLSREEGSSAPIAAQMVQSQNDRKDSPMIGGALSGMEVHVPEPEYPAKAKAEGVSGTVTVQVQVNKNGRVISARSSSGDQRLRAAAVKAAEKATFSAEKLAGREAIGTITYVFRL